MKALLTKFILLTAGAVVATVTFAQEIETRRPGGQEIQKVQIGGQSADQRGPYGYASIGSAERVVDLGGGRKYLTVTRLETIQINKDGKSIVWTFDTLGLPAFALSKVIPWAIGVTVYVEENPMYRGG